VQAAAIRAAAIFLQFSEVQMTDRIIVATFKDTKAAYDTAREVKELKDNGITDFRLKAGALVKKDEHGNISLLEARDRLWFGTAVGTLSGALIGLIGGAPGMAIGAALGATTGLTGDAIIASLDSDFIDSVTNEMRPGMTALIVEANEGSMAPVDDIVRRLGGQVHSQAA
jgi:uncharacterized membrane protein